MELNCDICGEAFTARAGAKYCSGKCRTEAYRVRRHGPKPKAARKPLPEAFWMAAYDVERKAEALERLAQDDRFKRNAARLAGQRSALIRAADAINRVVEQLPEPEPITPSVTSESPVTDGPAGEFVSPYVAIAEAARRRAQIDGPDQL